MICFDSDDFGANHVISDMCQSHDCRDMLYSFKAVNSLFKATLFAIPGEMTPELLDWASGTSWVELAWHGFFHTSNYECEKMTYSEFENNMMRFMDPVGHYRNDYTVLVKGFKAPGWQIGDDVYQWLLENGFWVADQHYNDERRPKDLPVYHVNENSIHTHTYNCVGNGVYELHDQIIERIKDETDFKFVSELV